MRARASRACVCAGMRLRVSLRLLRVRAMPAPIHRTPRRRAARPPTPRPRRLRRHSWRRPALLPSATPPPGERRPSAPQTRPPLPGIGGSLRLARTPPGTARASRARGSVGTRFRGRGPPSRVCPTATPTRRLQRRRPAPLSTPPQRRLRRHPSRRPRLPSLRTRRSLQSL